jgi:hypothetical protein
MLTPSFSFASIHKLGSRKKKNKKEIFISQYNILLFFSLTQPLFSPLFSFELLPPHLFTFYIKREKADGGGGERVLRWKHPPFPTFDQL